MIILKLEKKERPMTQKLRLFYSAFVMCFLIMATSSEAYEYKIVSLSANGYRSTGNGINTINQVAGTDYGSRYASKAYYYQPNGVKKLISSIFPGLSNTQSASINDGGKIVGWSSPGYGEICMDGPTVCTKAFIYQNGVSTKIPTLGGKYNRATSINNLGLITGHSQRTNNAAGHAFLYGGGQLKDLGTLGGSFSIGYGINDISAVTGASSLVGDVQPAMTFEMIDGYAYLTHAYIYANNNMKDIGALASGQSSVGKAINNVGEVTGWSGIGTGYNPRAFLYTNGIIKNLGAMNGTASVGNDINNKSQIVGWYAKYSYPSFRHAFLYRNGKMQDLNSLVNPGSGWELLNATSINDAGWIVGEGYNNPSLKITATFLAIPCPNSSC